MHRRLSGDPKQKITFSKSLSTQQYFIVPIEKADDECILLEDFFVILYTRIHKERAYHDEIMQLKDNLCYQINKLCDGSTDEKFIKFIRDQRQRIINAVVDETKIEQKMIAEKFYNDMMNGWDEKALDWRQFSQTVYAILWKPLLTPLPIEASNKLEGFIKGLENESSSAEIEKMITQFIEFIKKVMKAKEIEDRRFSTSEMLRMKLEKIFKKRRICNVSVSETSISENFVNEFKDKCIEKVSFEINDKKFLEAELKIKYDELKFSGTTDLLDCENIFNKIQKTVIELCLKTSRKADYNKLEKCFLQLIFLKSLSLDIEDGRIREKGIQLVSAGLKELKTISTLNLNLKKNDIGEEGAIALSTALKELKNILSLNLNLKDNDIGPKGAIALSAAIKELKNISTLKLNLEKNKIGGNEANAFSTAFKELKNISTLELELTNNNIGDEGAIALSFALEELTTISILNLNLCQTNVEIEGVKAISAALKKMKSISTLTLVLALLNIGDEGAIALSAGLIEIKNISALVLVFGENNIGDDGGFALLAALKELKKLLGLVLMLKGNNIGSECKTAIKELKDINSEFYIKCQI